MTYKENQFQETLQPEESYKLSDASTSEKIKVKHL